MERTPRRLRTHQAVNRKISHSSFLIVTGLRLTFFKRTVQVTYNGQPLQAPALLPVLIFRRQENSVYQGGPLRRRAPSYLQKLIKRLIKSGQVPRRVWQRSPRSGLLSLRTSHPSLPQM